MAANTTGREIKRRRTRFPLRTVPATPQDTPVVQRLRAAYTAGRIDFTDLHQRLGQLGADPDADVTGDLPAAPEPDWRAISRPTLRHLDRGVFGILAKISDPYERCLHAGAVAAKAEIDLDQARLGRTRALVSAHVRFEVPQAKCYQPYGILRKTFHDAVTQFPGSPPVFGSLDDAWAEADRWHVKYEAARATAETARMVRDAEIRALTAGKYGVPVQNIDLAKDLGVASARIAQIRGDGRQPVSTAA